MFEKVFLITNIEEYGKFISYCIEKDIQVSRTFWDESEKGDRCYKINYTDKRCCYSPRKYWTKKGYRIYIPIFYLDQYGKYVISSYRLLSGGTF